MELLIAFGTDDGENLNKGHCGMAKYYYVYRFSEKREEFVEKRDNVKVEFDESMFHGDSRKAQATSSVLKGLDGVVGRRFGPNLPRLLKKIVCIVARRETIKEAIELVRDNMDKIIQEKNRGEDRKHIVLS
ncbi:hypothetical protein KAW65_02520 [candidate division WOR-3 bacterium]|nr:hypothetical protein [candidate division WOR-3 bacterium]